jgi:hypothetical protein
LRGVFQPQVVTSSGTISSVVLRVVFTFPRVTTALPPHGTRRGPCGPLFLPFGSLSVDEAVVAEIQINLAEFVGELVQALPDAYGPIPIPKSAAVAVSGKPEVVPGGPVARWVESGFGGLTV